MCVNSSNSPLNQFTLLVQAMRMMNRRMNMPQLQKIMRDFEMQNEKMEMTGEMMGDAIDDAMGVRALVLPSVLNSGLDTGSI